MERLFGLFLLLAAIGCDKAQQQTPNPAAQSSGAAQATKPATQADPVQPPLATQAKESPPADPVIDGKPLSAWIEQAKDESPRQREKAMEAIAKAGDAAFAPLTELLGNADRTMAGKHQLEIFNFPIARKESAEARVAALEKAMDSKSAQIRTLAAESLADAIRSGSVKLSDQQLAKIKTIAVANLKGPFDQFIFKRSLLTLGDLGKNAEDVAPLVIEVSNKHSEVRREAKDALQRSIGPEEVQHLIKKGKLTE